MCQDVCNESLFYFRLLVLVYLIYSEACAEFQTSNMECLIIVVGIQT